MLNLFFGKITIEKIKLDKIYYADKKGIYVFNITKSGLK